MQSSSINAAIVDVEMCFLYNAGPFKAIYPIMQHVLTQCVPVKIHESHMKHSRRSKIKNVYKFEINCFVQKKFKHPFDN